MSVNVDKTRWMKTKSWIDWNSSRLLRLQFTVQFYNATTLENPICCGYGKFIKFHSRWNSTATSTSAGKWTNALHVHLLLLLNTGTGRITSWVDTGVVPDPSRPVKCNGQPPAEQEGKFKETCSKGNRHEIFILSLLCWWLSLFLIHWLCTSSSFIQLFSH